MINKTKAAMIALIGAPNVGKSTLLNKVIGQKISIVSPKVQTTRTVINGVLTDNNCQLVFIDTPGIFVPRANSNLEKAIVKGAWNAIEGVDFVCMIIDANKGFCENSELVIKKLKQMNHKVVLLVNKIDMLKKARDARIGALLEKFQKYEIFEKIILLSALKNQNIDLFLDFLQSSAPSGPYLFPEDETASVPQRFLVSEIVREKLFLFLNKELPYNLTVETELLQEQENGILKVHQIIYVTKDNHKMIVIGKGGSMIKKIGEKSRIDIEKMLGQKIYLELFVKVKENWLDDPDRFHNMGLTLR